MTKLQYYLRLARKMKHYLEDEYSYIVKVWSTEKYPPRVVLSLYTDIAGMEWHLLDANIYLDTERLEFVPQVKEDKLADYLMLVFGMSDTEAEIEVVDIIHQAISAVDEAWREV